MSQIKKNKIICHLIWSFSTGGAEYYIISLLNHQVKTNDVTLVVINDYFENSLFKLLNDKIKVKLIKRKINSKNPLYFFKLIINIILLKAEIVHAHNYNLIYFLIIFSKTKKYLTLHNERDKSWIIKYYDKVFVISEIIKNNLKKNININAIHIRSGVNHKLININKRSCKEEFIEIISVGRLEHKIKGQDLVLYALKYIADNYNYLNYKMTFIGNGSSLNYLIKLATNFNLNSHVRFLTNKSQDYIYKNLCNYDIFVMSSYYEGLGLSIIESMIAKVPVIVPDIEGPLTLINNGEYGFVFTKGNYKSLANCIINVFNRINEANLKYALETTRKHAIKNYSLDNMLREYDYYYNL